MGARGARSEVRGARGADRPHTLAGMMIDRIHVVGVVALVAGLLRPPAAAALPERPAATPKPTDRASSPEKSRSTASRRVRTPVRWPADPNCKPGPESLSEATIVAADKGLKNVFVYVKDGLGNARLRDADDAGRARPARLPLRAARVRRARRPAHRDPEQRPDAAQRPRRCRRPTTSSTSASADDTGADRHQDLRQAGDRRVVPAATSTAGCAPTRTSSRTRSSRSRRTTARSRSRACRPGPTRSRRGTSGSARRLSRSRSSTARQRDRGIHVQARGLALKFNDYGPPRSGGAEANETIGSSATSASPRYCFVTGVAAPRLPRRATPGTAPASGSCRSPSSGSAPGRTAASRRCPSGRSASA